MLSPDDFDAIEATWNELIDLSTADLPESWIKQTEIGEDLLLAIPPDGDAETDLARADIATRTGSALFQLIDTGMAGGETDASRTARARDHYEYALQIFRASDRPAEAGILAYNLAKVLVVQFEAGNTSAGERAAALFEEVLLAHRLAARYVNVATVGRELANLLRTRFEMGDRSVTDRAAGLLEEAYRLHEQQGDPMPLASTAHAWANFLAATVDAGDGHAAPRAHALYEEALTLRRHHGDHVAAALTSQNQAGLLVRAFERGDSHAAARAHARFDEALAQLIEAGHFTAAAACAQNQAALCLLELAKGNSRATRRAHTLFDLATRLVPIHVKPVLALAIRTNRLRLHAVGSVPVVTAQFASTLLADVARLLQSIADIPFRRTVIDAVAGTAEIGALAALRAGYHAWASTIVEAGRTFELAAGLRAAEARLSGFDRSTLNGLRASLQAARHDMHVALRQLTAEQTMEADPHMRVRIAEAALAQQNAAFNRLRESLNLDLDLSPPEPAELAAAIGSNAAIVMPVIGQRSGALLVLTQHQPAWQSCPVPQLTAQALADLLGVWFDGYDRFHADLSSGVSLDDAVVRFGYPVDKCCADLWNLLMGPVWEAVLAAGLTPANGAAAANEVVICPPGRLSVLPLHAAANAETGRRFVDDYALR